MYFPLSAAFSGGVSSCFVIPIYLYHACRNNARGTGAAPYCCTPRTPFSSDIPLAVLVPHALFLPYPLPLPLVLSPPPALPSRRVFLWVSLGDVEKGFGFMDKGIVILIGGAGVSAGDCGFVGRIRRFLRKKEKYAENILLFCTFYWYQ